MNNFFTSDLHRFHRNIIPYCNRPFKDVEEMDKYILDHIRSTTKAGDNLYILGDVAMNKKYAIALPKEVDCNLFLVSGNHDQTFPYHKKSQKFIDMFLEAGWKSVKFLDEMVLKDGTNVLMSHMPYPTENALKYDTRYLEWRPKDEGRVLLHGHLHGWYKKSGRLVDVGFDAHDCKILSEDQVIDLLNDKREFIESSITEHLKNRPKMENMKGEGL
jgi:calcineurin-like phosphoesterase family protein